MADEQDEPRDREPVSWRVRRWAAAIAMAVSVAASIGAVRLLADGGAAPSGRPTADGRTARFLLTVGSMMGERERGPRPWVQVRASPGGGPYRLVDSVRAPSQSAGEAREILEAPDGTFVVVATRQRPCESRLYRFRLTRAGRISGLARLTGDITPSRVGGLAMSPDGGKIAYTTASCTGDPKTAPLPRANVSVLDLGSGHRRTWRTSAPTLVGQIVWADDGRTLGYVISEVRPDAARRARSSSPSPKASPCASPGRSLPSPSGASTWPWPSSPPMFRPGTRA